MRTIIVCAGIGDQIWVIQKLINSGEQFNFLIPDGKPQRSKPLFDMLPQVAVSAKYEPHLGYSRVMAGNIQKRIPLWYDIKDQEFFLSCNEHVESGTRLERFLPDLPISFTLDYQTSEIDRMGAQAITSRKNKKYIGIYMSAYSSIRAWGFWTERGWLDLIQLFYKENKDLVFVIIGASFDLDTASKLIVLLEMHKIPFVDTIGRPLSVVVEIMKRLSYFIGFPSGLSIMNETLGKDGFMFYAPHISKIIETWADPERIASGQYKGAVFCEPERAFGWIKNEYQLFKKL